MLFTENIKYPNTNLQNTFLNSFSEIIKFILKIFYTIVLFDLTEQFVLQIYWSISQKKKISWLEDWVFEICIDCRFPVRGEVLKKCLP